MFTLLRCLSAFAILLSAHFLPGQAYSIHQTKQPPRIDGQLRDTAWQRAQVAGSFYQQFPNDSIPARRQTSVQLTYDRHFLYIAAVCHIEPGEQFQASTLFRDFNFRENDAFAVLLNPTTDRLNGYSFELTPFGSRGERLISNGASRGEEDWDYSWDNKWHSAVQRSDTAWTLEMAIPFRSLRFRRGQSSWRLNFIRNNLATNELSAWSAVPVNVSIENLEYTYALQWPAPPSQAGLNYSLIPSLTSGLTQGPSPEGPEEVDWRLKPSLDLKLALNNGLTLDGTVNPDFSQVEVDRQQLNIGRFELSFPEQRQFFIENSDLFAGFGTGGFRPFFSRRIGLVRNRQGLFEPTPILGGLRLTGKLNNRSRLGLMSVQTDDVLLPGEADSLIRRNGRNYTIAAFQQQVLSRSTASVIVANTEEFDGNLKRVSQNYSRLLGGQFNYASQDNLWLGHAFYFREFKHGSASQSYGLQAGRNGRHLGIFSSFLHIDRGFQPPTSFVPRSGINRLGFQPYYLFYPETDKINRIDVFHDATFYFDENYQLLDIADFIGTFWSLGNTSHFLLATNHLYTRLQHSFDPSNSDGKTLPAGSSYYYPELVFRYQSDRRKKFVYRTEARYGYYFNGKKLTLSGEWNYRLQPFLLAALNYEYNRIRLPAPYNDNDIFLLSPSLRFSFSNRIFLTCITQWNTLQSNIGTNIRFQWRFRPVSDLFLVYTDNFTDELQLINRSFSLKLVYWI